MAVAGGLYQLPVVLSSPAGAVERARDERWFNALYDETLESVHRYATVLVHDPCLVDDVVADTYLRAWRGRLTFRGDGRNLSWVLSITRHCSLDALQARREEVDLASISEPADEQAEQPWADGADFDALRAALSRLTLDQQQVLFLRFFREMPHEAIATELGRNPAAVRAIQFRALARLRKLMEAGHAR